MRRFPLTTALCAACLLWLQSAVASAQMAVLQAPGSPTVLLIEQALLTPQVGRRLDRVLGPLQHDLPPVADCPVVDTALLAGRLATARRIVAVVAAAQLPALREILKALPAHIPVDRPLAADSELPAVAEALALRAAFAEADQPLHLLLATPGD
jgi:hypothetical protein